MLYIVTVWLTKLSLSFFFLRLSPKRGHVRTSQVISVSAALTAIVSIMIVALQCDLSHPWIHINSQNAQCTGLVSTARSLGDSVRTCSNMVCIAVRTLASCGCFRHYPRDLVVCNVNILGAAAAIVNVQESVHRLCLCFTLTDHRCYHHTLALPLESSRQCRLYLGRQ